MSLSVKPDYFRIEAGTVATFDVVAANGRVKTCAFCPECGTRIYHRSEQGLSVKAGTLDETSALDPTAHFWVSRTQPWVVIPDDVTQCWGDG
jgi:hypothetical protein